MSLRDQLDATVQAAVADYGWTTERIGRGVTGIAYAVRDKGGYRGRLKYHQMRREWAATSPHTTKQLGWWGTLEQAIGDLLTLDPTNQKCRPRPPHQLWVTVEFELDERIRRAVGRRLGLDGMCDGAEFERWLRLEVEAIVRDVEQLQGGGEGEGDGHEDPL